MLNLGAEFWLRLIDVAIWPIIALIIFIWTRAWRLVDVIIKQGGSIGLQGVTVNTKEEFRQEIKQIQEQVGEEEIERAGKEIKGEGEDVNSEYESLDAYTIIMDSWSNLARAMANTLEKKTGEKLSLRSPNFIIYKLAQQQLIDAVTASQITGLLRLRDQVKVLGSKRYDRLGLTQQDALNYAAIVAAMKKRLSQN